MQIHAVEKENLLMRESAGLSYTHTCAHAHAHAHTGFHACARTHAHTQLSTMHHNKKADPLSL